MWNSVSHPISSAAIVQNAAARPFTGTKKRDHITPVLASPYWLPIKYGIDCKILLCVFETLRGLAPA